MRRLSFWASALLLASVAPAVAAPCSGDPQATVGAVTRFQDGDLRYVTRTLARQGPLAVQELMWLHIGYGDEVQSRYDVAYGFLGVGELADFLPGLAESSTTLADRPDLDEARLTEIAEVLGERDPDFKAAMDEMWLRLEPGRSASLVRQGEETRVTVVARERIEDFPDADGVTEAVVLETKGGARGRYRTWFSTEHCQTIRYRFSGEDDPEQAREQEVPLVRKIERRRGRPATPEAVVLQLNAAVNTLDAAAMAALIDPNWLAELKTAFEAAYRQGKQKAVRLLLGREMTPERLAGLSGADVYRAQLSTAMKNTPLAAVFMGLALDVTAVEDLTEKEARVSVRLTLLKEGEPQSRTTALTIVRTEAAGWLLRPGADRRDGFFCLARCRSAIDRAAAARSLRQRALLQRAAFGFSFGGWRGLAGAGLVVDQLPSAALAAEGVGGDQDRAADLLVAEHQGRVAQDQRAGVVAAHRRGIGVAQDAAPGVQHRLAADQGLPARMDAGHRLGRRPDLFHGVDVAAGEGQVEGLVGEEYGVRLAHGRGCLFWGARPGCPAAGKGKA